MIHMNIRLPPKGHSAAIPTFLTRHDQVALVSDNSFVLLLHQRLSPTGVVVNM